MFLEAAVFVTTFGFDALIAKDGPETSGAKPTVNAEKGAVKAVLPIDTQPAQKSDLKAVSPRSENKSTDQPEASDRSVDEIAIRLTGQSFVDAYQKKNAKAISDLFVADAEFIDEYGNLHQGRDEIQAAFTNVFWHNSGTDFEMEISSIRFLSPQIAIEDGTTTVNHSVDLESVSSRYTAVHVKENGNWLTASVREQAPHDRRQHRSRLQQLAWLQGDWVDEDEESVVVFSCAPTDGGRFLIRNFAMHIAGCESMTGTQRIGWDPLTGKLKAWVFDSEGGHSEGWWHRDQDRWVLKLTGVTAAGEPASSTSIYTPVDERSMTWQSVDHEINGVELPDSEVVTIVRRAPTPVFVDDKPVTNLK